MNLIITLLLYKDELGLERLMFVKEFLVVETINKKKTASFIS